MVPLVLVALDVDIGELVSILIIQQEIDMGLWQTSGGEQKGEDKRCGKKREGKKGERGGDEDKSKHD